MMSTTNNYRVSSLTLSEREDSPVRLKIAIKTNVSSDHKTRESFILFQVEEVGSKQDFKDRIISSDRTLRYLSIYNKESSNIPTLK